MRAKSSDGDNQEFAKYLLKIGDGDDDITEDVNGENLIPIPPELLSKSKTIDEFCKEIFPRLRDRVKSGMKNRLIHDDQEWVDWLMSRACLLYTSDAADE